MLRNYLFLTREEWNLKGEEGEGDFEHILNLLKLLKPLLNFFIFYFLKRKGRVILNYKCENLPFA